MAFRPERKKGYRKKRAVKKAVSLLTASMLTFSLTACGEGESSGSGSTIPETEEPIEETIEEAAGETGVTYTGTVSEISADTLTITTENEGDITVSFSDQTVFGYGGGMGSGGSGESGQGAPPEKPEGESMGAETEVPPEKPEGENPAGGETAPPELPEGEMPQDMANQEQLTYEDIAVGDIVTVVVDSDGIAESVMVSGAPMPGGGPGGASSAPDSYDSANEYTEDTQVSDTALSSEGADENAVLVSTKGIHVSLDGVTINRDSEDSTGGDNASFYGVGAAALVTDGTLSVSDSSVTTDADGGAGVFSYGSGTAYVSDTTITTQKDTSGGIHVAGGGTLYAGDLIVETNGESSAAVRSDRGSGTMVVDGGTYTSNGVGSPAVYSTADITIHNADLNANGSEAICIEGLNTIRLFDCNLSGNMSDLEQNDCTWNVILYQSMSGDSEVGNSTFEMTGGTLTAKNGGMFYTTNTESTFILSGVEIVNAADSEFLLKCTGNSNQRGWGTAGANGADCHFTAIEQVLEGDVIWDSISKLDFYLTEGSTLTGAVLDDETNAGTGGSGYANVYIDAGSTWIVTGDSTLTALACAGQMTDAEGNTVSIVGTDGTVYVSGTSDYTVTVESYTADVDTSGASSVENWSDFEATKL